MLRIRLSIGGVRKRPIYKIVVADSRFPRDGRFVEKLGSYNPLLPKEKKERIKVEAERVKHWISKGAKPTLRVSRILAEVQLMPMPKPGNNPLKAIPKKDRKKKQRKMSLKKKRLNKKQKKKHLNRKKKEAPKQEEKKEAPKQEAKKEAPKQEEKKEAPKQEEKKEAPKQEAKKEAPKQEEKERSA